MYHVLGGFRKQPNAGPELRLEAGATQERTLEAVGCSARLCQNPRCQSIPVSGNRPLPIAW
jgi:hypothetical protein